MLISAGIGAECCFTSVGLFLVTCWRGLSWMIVDCCGILRVIMDCESSCVLLLLFRDKKRSSVGFSWFWNSFDEDCTAGSFAGDWVEVTKQSHWSPPFLWFPNSAPVKITGGSLQTASNYKSESSLATKTERTDVTDVSTADDVDCALVVFCHPGRSPQKTQKGFKKEKTAKRSQRFLKHDQQSGFSCDVHDTHVRASTKWNGFRVFFLMFPQRWILPIQIQGDVLDAWPRLVNVSLMLSWNESPRRHGVPRRVLLREVFFLFDKWKNGTCETREFLCGLFKILYCKQKIYTCQKNQYTTVVKKSHGTGCLHVILKPLLIPLGCFWNSWPSTYVDMKLKSLPQIWLNLADYDSMILAVRFWVHT